LVAAECLWLLLLFLLLLFLLYVEWKTWSIDRSRRLQSFVIRLLSSRRFWSAVRSPRRHDDRNS
jgi:hypothetical protein